MSAQRVVAMAFLLACATQGARQAGADTILLMNGNEVSGTIVDVNADPMVLLIPGGSVTFELTEIQEVDLNDKGFQGKAKDAAPGSGPAADAAQITPSIADLPPPTTDEERGKRFDTLMGSISALTRSPEEASQEMRDREGDYITALGRLGPSVAPQIESTIRHGDARQAAPMLAALEIADPARAAALARDSVNHVHPEARAEAIRIVASSSDADRGKVLAKALGDPMPQNRLEALAGIAETKDASVAVDAAHLVDDASPEVQTQAIATLQALTGESYRTAAEWQQWAQAHGGGDPTLNATTVPAAR